MHTLDDSVPGRVFRMKANRARQCLIGQGERAMKHAAHDAIASVRVGKPLEAIVASAKEYKPDLIIMARHRRRRLDVLIGTTAERVIRSTHHSVLLVSGDAERAYERVVLATDLSSSSVHTAQTMREMGVLNNASAWAVHAFGPPYQEFILAGSLNAQETMLRKASSEIIQRHVLLSLADAGVDLGRVEVLAEQARPIDGVERALDRVQADLLVIGVSRWIALKRILLGSVADQVFRKVNCDILAIVPPSFQKTQLRAA